MKKEKKGFALLLEWAGDDKKYVYRAIILALLASVLSIVPYFAFYKIIDTVSTGKCTFDTAITWAVVLLVGIAVKLVLQVSSTLSSHKGAYHTLFKVRCMVTKHMAKMPLGALNERSTGEIKTVMNESIEKLELFLAHNLPELVLYLSGPIVMFIYLMTVKVSLALISLVPLLLAFLTMIVMFMRFKLFMDEVNESSGNLSSAINEYVNGMRLVKAFHMSSRSFHKYSKAMDDQHKVWGDISKATGPLYAIYVVLLECGILFLVPMGGYLYLHGNITASVLLLFAFVGTQYLSDVRPLQEIANNFSFVLSGVKQVKDILDTPVFEGGSEFPDDSDIELTDVTFAYEEGKNILQNVNLHIEKGERIAFVGESGAGKSTLVQLISRFYDVNTGTIKIGGVNVKDIGYEQLLSHVSVVFQQSFLARGSVYENIAMGITENGSNMTLEEVRKAAKKAQIDDFIMSLPEQYETKVGGYGTRFSGGQKQRICIARAILKDAPILILDEATSAADPENQVEIDKAIENLCIGKTVIIVAHRLGIVQNCNRIAVVEKQSISGVGTFEEIKEKNTYFNQAWNNYVTARNMKYSLKEGAINE